MTVLIAALAAAGTLDLTSQVRLVDADGTPLDGSERLEVRLVDASTPTGGEDVCFTAVFDPVPVQDGYATLRLDGVPDACLDAQRWLAVAVGNPAVELSARLPIADVMVDTLGAREARISGMLTLGTALDTECDADHAGALIYRAGSVMVCDGAGSFTALGAGAGSVTLELVNGARRWSDGTYARSCYGYRYPCGAYTYEPGAGPSGVYTIDPDGPATTYNPMSVYCDMQTNGGGYTLVAQAQPRTGTQYSLCTTGARGTLDLDEYTVTDPAKLPDALINAIWTEGGGERLVLHKTDVDRISGTPTGWDNKCELDFNPAYLFSGATNVSSLGHLDSTTVTCHQGTLESLEMTIGNWSTLTCGYAYANSTGAWTGFTFSIGSSYGGGSCAGANAGRSWSSPGNNGCNTVKIYVR